MSDRFDFEQQLLNCWQVTADIDTLCEGALEQDLTIDQIANVLLGINELYELRFNKCFNTFEELIRSGQFTGQRNDHEDISTAGLLEALSDHIDDSEGNTEPAPKKKQSRKRSKL